MNIEKKEFWGNTRASKSSIYGLVIGFIGCYLALEVNILLLSFSFIGVGLISYALFINYNLGFTVRWRLPNFILHIVMLIMLSSEIVYVLLQVYA